MAIPIWQRLTLRLRTGILISLFMWFTGAVVGLVCRSELERLMYRQTDVELREDAREFASIANGQPLPWGLTQTEPWNRRVALQPLHGLFIRVINSQRDPIWESITIPRPLPDNLDIHSTEIQTSGSYRVIHSPIRLRPEMLQEKTSGAPHGEEHVDAFLQVGCSLEMLRNTMREVDTWLLSGLGVLMLAGPCLAWFLASWILEPVKTLTQETDTIPIDTDRLIPRTRNHDELDRLAETVNTLLVRVRSHLKSNEDWIANSAHQLRGPLAAIVSNVEVVAGRLPDGKSRAMLDNVLVECEYLKRLVNQLLLLGEARADRHPAVRQTIAWQELIERSSDFFEALAQSRDIQIRFDRLDPCQVIANPEHLRYVIHNLIDNAIKYTPEGGEVHVSLERDDRLGVCQLRIRDTGIGISEEDQDKLGSRFFRSDSGRDPQQTPRGSGLGLHIVRTIVDALGGSVQIQSRLGDGTSVTVTLPIHRDEASRNTPAPSDLATRA